MLAIATDNLTGIVYATKLMKNRRLRQRVNLGSPSDKMEGALQFDDFSSVPENGGESGFGGTGGPSGVGFDNNLLKHALATDIGSPQDKSDRSLQYDDPAFPPPPDHNGQKTNEEALQLNSVDEYVADDPFRIDKNGRELDY